MEKRVLYSETVPAYALTVILLSITLLMACMLFYQIYHGPIGARPAPNSFLACLAIFFLLVGMNFHAIRIRLTDVEVRVSYGIFRRTLAWKDIASCEADDQSALRYGGWGIRFGILRGKKVMVFNTFGGKRVAFFAKSAKSRGLAASTRNRDELMRIANQQIHNFNS